MRTIHFVFIVLLLYAVCLCKAEEEPYKLGLLLPALLPFEGLLNGTLVKWAAESAVELLNSDPSERGCLSPSDEKLNFTLIYRIVGEDGNQFGHEIEDDAVREGLELLEDEDVIGLIGPTLTESAERLSKEGGAVFKKPIISWATGESLSDRSEHPWFLRIWPSDATVVEGMIDVIFSLQRLPICFIYRSATAYGRQGADDVRFFVKDKEMEIHVEASFDDEDDIDDAMTKFVGKECGSFIAFADSEWVELISDKAREHGLWERGDFWIFPNVLGEAETDTADAAILRQKLAGAFALDIEKSLFRKKKFYYNEMLRREMGENAELTEELAEKYGFDPYPFIFDAVLAYGFATAALLNDEKSPNNGTHLLEELNKVDFMSAGGRVGFSHVDGDRIGLRYDVMVIHDDRVDDIGYFSEEGGLEWVDDIMDRIVTVSNGNQTKDILEDQAHAGEKWESMIEFSSPPTPRQNSASLVWKDKFILYGGIFFDDMDDRVYEFDIKRKIWKPMLPFSSEIPVPRYDHSITLAGDYMYVFGGQVKTTMVDLFYSFNLQEQTWSRISTTVTPIPRIHTGMVYHSNDNSIYLFGGKAAGAGLLNDIWQYKRDQNVWERVDVVTPRSQRPAPRAAFGLVISESKMFVFGGQTTRLLVPGEQSATNDLWSFDIVAKTWSKIQTTNNPNPRFLMGAAIYENQIYIMFGGSTGHVAVAGGEPEEATFNDVWRVDVTDTSGTLSWELIEEDVPDHVGRDEFNVAIWCDTILWFSGASIDGDLLEDFWIFDTTMLKATQIQKVSEPSDAAYDHSGVRIGTQFLIFGGYSSISAYSNELFAFHLDKDEWEQLFPSGLLPPRRLGHGAAQVGARMFIFGGRFGDDYYADMWIYSVESNSWTQAIFSGPSPDPRAEMTMLGDGGANIYIIAGEQAEQEFGDVWEYHTDFRVFERKGDLNRTVHSCSGTFISKGIILSGCVHGLEEPHDWMYLLNLETYDLENYLQYPQALVSTRHTLVHVGNDKLVMYGGHYDETVNNDLWLVTNGEDSPSVRRIALREHLGKPDGRTQHVGVYYKQNLIIFGGISGSYDAASGRSQRINSFVLNDIWQYLFNDVCNTKNNITDCVACSPGTYEFKAICLPCPTGTYQDEFGSLDGCKKCPPGFNGPRIGASSIKQCIPCPEGTYGDQTGLSQCIPCKDDEVCHIGSVKATPRGLVVDYRAMEVPDITKPNPTVRTSIIHWVLMVASLGFGATVATVCIILLFICWKIKVVKTAWICKLDVFFQTRHQYPKKTPKVKKPKKSKKESADATDDSDFEMKETDFEMKENHVEVTENSLDVKEETILEMKKSFGEEKDLERKMFNGIIKDGDFDFQTAEKPVKGTDEATAEKDLERKMFNGIINDGDFDFQPAEKPVKGTDEATAEKDLEESGNGLSIVDPESLQTEPVVNKSEFYLTKKQTVVGGMFSIISLFVIGGFLIASCINYFFLAEDITELRSLVPSILLQREDGIVRTTATLSVNLLIRGAPLDSCAFNGTQECFDGITASSTGISIGEAGLMTRCSPVEKVRDGEVDTRNSGCMVTVGCRNCLFGEVKNFQLEIDHRVTGSYATEFDYRVESTSGYPRQNASISGKVFPQQTSLFFRGTREPTTLGIAAFPTYFTDLSGFQTSKNETGFHFDFNSIDRGDEVNFQEFNHENGVRVVFDFVMPEDTLEIIVRQRRHFILFFVEMAAQLTGIIATIGVGMSLFERVAMKVGMENEFIEVIKRKTMKSTPVEKFPIDESEDKVENAGDKYAVDDPGKNEMDNLNQENPDEVNPKQDATNQGGTKEDGIESETLDATKEDGIELATLEAKESGTPEVTEAEDEEILDSKDLEDKDSREPEDKPETNHSGEPEDQSNINQETVQSDGSGNDNVQREEHNEPNDLETSQTESEIFEQQVPHPSESIPNAVQLSDLNDQIDSETTDSDEEKE